MIGMLIAIGIMAGLPGVVAAPGLSNSGGGMWKYQRDKVNKKNNIDLK